MSDRAPSSPRPLAGLLLFLLACPTTHATQSDNLIPLDWLVANSVLVVRGRMTDDISELPVTGSLATVEVTETLKGPRLPRVTFISRGYSIHPARDRAADVLLCLEQHLFGDTPW